MIKISDGKSVTPIVLIGTISVIYGMSIYYLLPLALLTMNLTLLLDIFFLILLGMIFGLTLLAHTLQQVLEWITVHVLLFFERKSMKQMIVKNLIAHKIRNSLTSIIYSLTLGCLIFLVVMLNLQGQSLTASEAPPGADLYTTCGFFLGDLTDLIDDYSYAINEVAFRTENSLVASNWPTDATTVE